MRFEKSNLLESIPSVRHGFFGRHGGTSPNQWRSLNTSYDVDDAPARVTDNRTRICHALGFDLKTLVAPKQIHSTHALQITHAGENQREGDALWTISSGILLAIQTADCIPILLASKDGTCIAAIHAGWRGAVKNVVGEAMQKICTATSLSPSDFIAAIGPAISMEKYEVGQEVVDQAGSFFSPLPTIGKYLFDLPGFCKNLLEKSGVTQIDTIPHCTATLTNDYFSHRAQKGKTGRQMSAIGLVG